VNFEFATACGCCLVRQVAEVPAALRAQGVRRILVATNLQALGERLRSLLTAAGIESCVARGSGTHVESCRLLWRGPARGLRRRVGLGGGSAMDTGKPWRSGHHRGVLLDYLEVVVVAALQAGRCLLSHPHHAAAALR